MVSKLQPGFNPLDIVTRLRLLSHQQEISCKIAFMGLALPWLKHTDVGYEQLLKSHLETSGQA